MSWALTSLQQHRCLIRMQLHLTCDVLPIEVRVPPTAAVGCVTRAASRRRSHERDAEVTMTRAEDLVLLRHTGRFCWNRSNVRTYTQSWQAEKESKAMGANFIISWYDKTRSYCFTWFLVNKNHVWLHRESANNAKYILTSTIYGFISLNKDNASIHHSPSGAPFLGHPCRAV